MCFAFQLGSNEGCCQLVLFVASGFEALKADGSVVAWGDGNLGGDAEEAPAWIELRHAQTDSERPLSVNLELLLGIC